MFSAINCISGFENTITPTSTHKAHISLLPEASLGTDSISVETAIVEITTAELPEKKIVNVKKLRFVRGVQLSDPDFDHPGRFYLLLGVGSAHKIMLTRRLESADGELFVHQSIFGWIVCGNCAAANQTAHKFFSTSSRMQALQRYNQNEKKKEME